MDLSPDQRAALDTITAQIAAAAGPALPGTLMGASRLPVLSEMRGAGGLLRQQPAGEHTFDAPDVKS
jgi:hypothetical protein